MATVVKKNFYPKILKLQKVYRQEKKKYKKCKSVKMHRSLKYFPSKGFSIESKPTTWSTTMTGQSLRSISSSSDPLKNRKRRLCHESISNYRSIMYSKVAREQKLVKPSLKIFPSFCSLVTFQYIIDLVAYIFLKKSTLPIPLRVLSSSYDELEIHLEV